MEILEMIAEWRKGCSLSGKNAINCPACTEALIDAIEQKEKLDKHSGCITPKLYLVVDRLRDAASSHPENEKQRGLHNDRIVDRKDLEALLHEFFRMSKQLHKLKPHIHVAEEEDHRVC